MFVIFRYKVICLIKYISKIYQSCRVTQISIESDKMPKLKKIPKKPVDDHLGILRYFKIIRKPVCAINELPPKEDQKKEDDIIIHLSSDAPDNSFNFDFELSDDSSDSDSDDSSDSDSDSSNALSGLDKVLLNSSNNNAADKNAIFICPNTQKLNSSGSAIIGMNRPNLTIEDSIIQ
ncbi:ORF-5 peptide [Chrysodeixis chalcites nucleopolyhedrovirus]|uniref:ORF-5 peptide n=1 Tax=Chrysodeixis chalcites nucleopolyhedrovirus TaxID=320432 RepID=Q4KT75_9ABAC|nr:ORF-5 peptide [Chrysodeixis chalcites nucleopolyhedrovirus]AAY83936.1 ORF-5 peptide [Chrysodeixis chalcites nucleopolyhedrovirus]